ncbi:UNVERIFIED_CONTAM: putative membrane protein [Brevibacillus sp. OAP136]
MNTRETGDTKQQWIPKKERLWVMVSIMIAVVLVIWQLYTLMQVPAETLASKRFEHTFKDLGSNARIALFFVLANYVLLLVMRLRVLDGAQKIKKALAAQLRFVRRWHTPVAIIAIAFIILHTVAVFMYGFTFDFSNVSGLLALLVLLPVPISGLFRYRRLDRKWHLRTGVAFAVLFLLHAFL